MPSPNNWLLVDVLDPQHPTVVAIGTRPKGRVALRSFVRAWDRDLALAAASDARRGGTHVQHVSGSRAVTADPISDEVTGLVHGVWLQISKLTADPGGRPSAWAFEWDLTTGVARRGAIVSDTQSWEALGIDQRRPISDGLAKLDLGPSVAPVLASLVSGTQGKVVQQTAVEWRPSGSHRNIQFTAHFASDPMKDAEHQEARLVRGLSVDLGPFSATGDPDPRGASLGDQIAQSLCDPGEYRAIADPDSLRLLYWYGSAPPNIAWRSAHITNKKPVLHPADVLTAMTSAKMLKNSPPGTASKLRLRLLTHQDTYVPVQVTARTIDLEGNSRALLLVLRPETDR